MNGKPTATSQSSHSVSVGNPQEQVAEDYKYNYHVARLFYGLLMVNTHDSIREGDAAGLMDCTKMSLLFFKKFKKHKFIRLHSAVVSL